MYLDISYTYSPAVYHFISHFFKWPIHGPCYQPSAHSNFLIAGLMYGALCSNLETHEVALKHLQTMSIVFYWIWHMWQKKWNMWSIYLCFSPTERIKTELCICWDDSQTSKATATKTAFLMTMTKIDMKYFSLLR